MRNPIGFGRKRRRDMLREGRRSRTPGPNALGRCGDAVECRLPRQILPAKHRNRSSFPCVVAFQVAENAGTEQRWKRLSRVQAFDRFVQHQRRLGLGHAERVFTKQQERRSRAEVRQRHERAPSVAQELAREVTTRGRQGLYPRITMDDAQAPGVLFEKHAASVLISSDFHRAGKIRIYG